MKALTAAARGRARLARFVIARKLARWSAPLLLVAAATVQADSLPEVDLERAAQISKGRCALCHGEDGNSNSALYPRLAGQHHQYITKQLADFQSGARSSDTMEDMVQGLNEADMQALGVYFEKMPTKPRPARDAQLAAVGEYIFQRGNTYSGVAACSSCHGERGLGTELLPRLAGQVPKYTESQLASFDSRQRTNDNAIMHSIASRLTELEVKAVSLYISTLD